MFFLIIQNSFLISLSHNFDKYAQTFLFTRFINQFKLKYHICCLIGLVANVFINLFSASVRYVTGYLLLSTNLLQLQFPNSYST